MKAPIRQIRFCLALTGSLWKSDVTLVCPALCILKSSAKPFNFPRILQLAFLRGFVAVSLLSPAFGLITRIEEIRTLAFDAPSSPVPVLVRAVVTAREGNNMTVEDETAGIWVSVDVARGRGIWQGKEADLQAAVEGMEVEIAGFTDPGGYAPVLVATTIRVLGSKPLPPVKPVEHVRFFNGSEDSQRVEVRGVVQRITRRGNHWELLMDGLPGRFFGEIPPALFPDPRMLIDAELCLRGVAGSHFNTRGEFVSPRLFVRFATDIVIEKPAVPEAEIPLIPLHRLFAFRPEPVRAHRQRVVGTVTFAVPGQFFYLQEGDDAIRVASQTAVTTQAGDRVEVIGFLNGSGVNGGMTEATVKKLGVGKVPEAIWKSPETIMTTYEKQPYGSNNPQFDDYDGRLIRFEAKVVSVRGSPDLQRNWRQVTLEQGNLILGAILHEGATAALDRLEPGSLVDVRGILKLDFTSDNTDLEILKRIRTEVTLRSSEDIRVIRAPPWWTPRRLLMVIATVLGLLGIALLWAFVLRREISRKMQIISSKLSSEAVSGERNRVARDLHDTLEQQLAGVALQLDGAKKVLTVNSAAASSAMDLASRMLRHTRLEARRSVWDLRSQVLESQGLVVALRTMAESVATPHGPCVDVRVTDEPGLLPAGVDFQLLRVAQEALANALKHAQASHIVISLETLPEGLRLRIRDDGQGFSAHDASQPNGGHFGLLGMQERAIKVGGHFTIEGPAGKGCTVTVFIPKEPDPNFQEAVL